MAAFNKPQATERRSLADIIMEKIKEKEQQLELVPKAMPGGAPGTLQILKTRSQTSCANNPTRRHQYYYYYLIYGLIFVQYSSYNQS